MRSRLPGIQRHSSQRSSPTSLGTALAELIKEWGVQTKILEAQAILSWKDVTGDPLSSVSEPLSVKRGTLFVSIEGSVWKHQLSFLKRDIIEQLNRRVGGDVIKDIRIATDKREKGKHGRNSRTISD